MFQLLMNSQKILRRLDQLYFRLPHFKISRADRIVIFSDLHMGSGGKHDDFLKNSTLFQYILQHYYDSRKYLLFLNGDIEELQRFSSKKILLQWKDIYGIFLRFLSRKALFKIVGNHDYYLYQKKKSLLEIPVHEGFILQSGQNEIVLFHGFQAHRHPKIYYMATTVILRLLANPFGIRNYSVAYNNRKRYTVEKRVYQFAKQKKVIAIIGHTHRPLFESLSKLDTLKFNIEQICRIYPGAKKVKKKELEQKLAKMKNELHSVLSKKNKNTRDGLLYLYVSEPLVPSVFNSGCVIGQRGITAIEISGNEIRLVYWFDHNVEQKNIDFYDKVPEKFGNSNYHRLIMKHEDLDYIFTRVKLLT